MKKGDKLALAYMIIVFILFLLSASTGRLERNHYDFIEGIIVLGVLFILTK